MKFKPKQALKVVLSNKGKDKKEVREIIKLCKDSNILAEYNDKAIQRISVRKDTYAIGCFEKFSESLDKQANHVVLVSPSKLGNIGRIIRTMRAFEFTNLALIRPSADIFDPKVVRSAMGAFFQIKFQYFDSFGLYHQSYSEHKIYPFMPKAGKPISSIKFQSPFSLVFGSEGHGLESGFEKNGQPVYIPQSPAIESLNLSTAVGIALWEAAK